MALLLQALHQVAGAGRQLLHHPQCQLGRVALALVDGLLHLVDKGRHLAIGLGLAVAHLHHQLFHALGHCIGGTGAGLLDAAGELVEALRGGLYRAGGLLQHVAHAAQLAAEHAVHLGREAAQHIGQHLVHRVALAVADGLDRRRNALQRLLQALGQAGCDALA